MESVLKVYGNDYDKLSNNIILDIGYDPYNG